MAFVVSARKYRPQKFEDVLGQSHVTETLKNAILSDKLAHSFLFTGPRGVGKTTCARILAKVINTPDPKIAVEDGSYVDTDIDISLNIFELDAASNNSVDHIRTLVEQVRIQPHQGKYKIFIIDEVHMLSTSAFNAFLKTLEEPPPYAIFILATTEKHKIIPTILSRCQIFDFKRISTMEIIEQMKKIISQESLNVEEEALHLIAEKADGAMRDALSIFDRIVFSGGTEVTYKSVIQKLNILDYDYYFRACDCLLKEDSASLLMLLDEVLTNGFEADHFINGLGRHMRQLLVAKQSKTMTLLDTSETLKEKYLSQASMIGVSQLMSSLQLINECDIQFPLAKDKRLHIEVCLLKLCFISRLVSHEGVIAQEEKKKPDTHVVSDPSASTTIIRDHSENVVPKADPPPTLAEEEIPVMKTEEVEPPNISFSLDSILNEVIKEEKSKPVAEVALDVDSIQEIWGEYTTEVSSQSTKSVLNKAMLSLHGRKLVVKVPTNISRDMILHEKSLFELIREKVLVADLEVEVEVDADLFPEEMLEKPKKLMNEKEKHAFLVERNPLLHTLIEKLDLRPDNSVG